METVGLNFHVTRVDIRVIQSWPDAVLSEPVVETWAYVKVKARSGMSY